MLHCRVDSLMSGCFVALCVGMPSFEAAYQKIARVWWILPLEFWGVSLLMGNLFGLVYRKSIGLTVDSLVVAFFILWATRNANHWVGRLLNSRIMVQAGVISYSAYIWQTFFLHEGNKTWSGKFHSALCMYGLPHGSPTALSRHRRCSFAISCCDGILRIFPNLVGKKNRYGLKLARLCSV